MLRSATPLALHCMLVGVILGGCVQPGPVVGSMAPPVDLTDIDGNAVGSASAAGGVLVLDFMGARCSSCHLATVRALVPLYESYGNDTNITFLSVDVGAAYNRALGGRGVEDVAAFKDDTGAPWAFAIDTTAQETSIRYEVIGLPTLYIIDANGIIAFKETGLPTFECLKGVTDHVVDVGYDGSRLSC